MSSLIIKEKPFRNWFKGFTKETIIHELKVAGFHSFEIYADVLSRPI
ncbi:hypothetical protein [Mesobacillus boroniphilus]|nr:hypothetical protein [Mesobacillus boroniphilus]